MMMKMYVCVVVVVVWWVGGGERYIYIYMNKVHTYHISHISPIQPTNHTYIHTSPPHITFHISSKIERERERGNKIQGIKSKYKHTHILVCSITHSLN